MDTLDIILNVGFILLTILISCLSYYFNIKAKLTAQINNAINEAEDLEASGKEKLDAAVDNVMNYIPTIVKPFLPRSVIETLIQNSFDIIEAYAKKQVKEENKSND